MRRTPTTPLVGAVVVGNHVWAALVGNLAVGHVRRPVLGGVGRPARDPGPAVGGLMHA